MIDVFTHKGLVRETNQDDYAIHENGYGLYIVADGMGGHRCGEIASRVAVNAAQKYLRQYLEHGMTAENMVNTIRAAYTHANRNILDYVSLEPVCAGMGTTMTTLICSEEHAVIGHVGDSRAYRFLDGSIVRLTKDHSLVEELFRRGEITAEEAENHPQKHVITRALGMSDTLQADVVVHERCGDDIFLLCTDGLTNHLSDDELGKWLNKVGKEKNIAQKMVNSANDRGGHDNVTVLIATGSKSTGR